MVNLGLSAGVDPLTPGNSQSMSIPSMLCCLQHRVCVHSLRHASSDLSCTVKMFISSSPPSSSLRYYQLKSSSYFVQGQPSQAHLCSMGEKFVTVHEKTRCKSKIVIFDNAHLNVQTLWYFMLKSDWPNGDKITSVSDNAILFSAFYSSLFILISSAETLFSQKMKEYLVFSCTFTFLCHTSWQQSNRTKSGCALWTGRSDCVQHECKVR